MELGIGQSVGVWNMWCGCLEYVVWVYAEVEISLGIQTLLGLTAD